MRAFCNVCVIVSLCSTCVTAAFGFVPSNTRPMARYFNRPTISLAQRYATEMSADVQHAESRLETPKCARSALWRRLDTLTLAGLKQPSPKDIDKSRQITPIKRNPTPPLLSSAATLGFVGHTGLFLASTLLVTIIKGIFFTKPLSEEEELAASAGEPTKQAGGVMDRCPWPFIFFHDPKQGLKDSPTWIVVCWVALWRLWRYRAAVKVA